MAERAANALQSAPQWRERNARLAREALSPEMARWAKLAGLPLAEPQDSTPMTDDADLDTEARALLAVQRLRKDSWVQTTAASIVAGDQNADADV